MLQLRTKSLMVTFFSSTPIAIVAELPENSWPPDCRIKSKFAGKSAAKATIWAMCWLNMFPPSTKDSKQAIPTYAPPIIEATKVFCQL
mmetsp:Transcript_63281/g.77467  ORF Transcript_63281/g.77467 Transcript_63281/m.77467 type:complete len:88 (-) Transcript_63281:94-357(-)